MVLVPHAVTIATWNFTSNIIELLLLIIGMLREKNPFNSRFLFDYCTIAPFLTYFAYLNLNFIKDNSYSYNKCSLSTFKIRSFKVYLVKIGPLNQKLAKSEPQRRRFKGALETNYAKPQAENMLILTGLDSWFERYPFCVKMFMRTFCATKSVPKKVVFRGFRG